MTKTPITPQAQLSDMPTDDEINLNEIARCCFRNKKLIFTITASTILLSSLFAFSRKPV